MLVFVCTDLHGRHAALKGVERQLEHKKYAAVFMLGDLCQGHDLDALRYARDFIDMVDSFDLPLYLVHGNQEPVDVRLLYQQRGVTVHFNERKLDNYSIIGVGYGDTFPTDPKFAQDKILLTHEPPRSKVIANMKQKTNPDLSTKVGAPTKVSQFTNAPILHLSGHLHSIAKVHLIGSTVLVQVPAATDMRAAEIDLKTRKVNFLHLPN